MAIIQAYDNRSGVKQKIVDFANARGISESAAVKILLLKALAQQ